MSSVQTSDPTRHVSLCNGSAQMRAIGTIIENIADTDATVLIRGESGVGKDLVARAIHARSSRRHGPFVKINCAAIPSGLLESEFFGHEKGAFTGAHRRKPGQFEYADKGTIYLDEIGELPLALQAKLLHVLQDFRFARVGGCGWIDVDSRVIAATNRDLEEAMARGEFRADLYYRVNVVEIRVPPLRERREEIPVLASWFLDKFNAQYGRQKQLSPETMTRLQQHSCSGNVRWRTSFAAWWCSRTSSVKSRPWWPVVGTGTARSRSPPPRAYGRSRGGGRERPSVERSRTCSIGCTGIEPRRPGSSRSVLAPPLRRQSADPRPAASCVPMTGRPLRRSRRNNHRRITRYGQLSTG